MLRLLLVSITLIFVSSCGIGPESSELKSPCVSISNPDGTQAPCVRRKINDNWLG